MTKSLIEKRNETLEDAVHFADHLVRKLEALLALEQDERAFFRWQQMLPLIKRSRAMLRYVKLRGEHRGERRVLGMRERTRT